jgi:type IV pilus assembly protein PilF
VRHEFSKKMKQLIALVLSGLLAACATSSSNREASDNYYQLGVRYLNMNKIELAKGNLERSLEKDSSNAQAHNALAFLYEKINQYEAAEDQYEAALNLAPDDLGALNNFGRFLCEHGKQERGMALLTQAISAPLNDKPWMALTNAGRCQLEIKNRQAAEDYFRQALQLNPVYAPALLEMQKVSYQKSDFWAAKGYLERYLGVAEHNSESLWLAMQTERALGNEKVAEKYRIRLLEKFPLSDEAKKIKPAR